MATVFFSYCHKDEALRDELETHLAMLKRTGVVETWHDRRIAAGDNLDQAIDQNLERASVVLLLVSPDFLASNYCYDVEVKRAMERHEEGSARVIPVILRPCDWHNAPFGKLLAAPKDGKAVTRWPDRDEAFVDVVQRIKSAVPRTVSSEPPRAARLLPAPTTESRAPATSRSSNLRLKKTFTDADRDSYLDEAFEFLALFFQNSLTELQERNEGISTRFKRLDAEAFSAVIYRNGDRAAGCGIRRGANRSFGASISFSFDESAPRNSFNESLSVAATDQSLYLCSMGFGMTQHTKHLTPEGAAELLWAMLIERLQ